MDTEMSRRGGWRYEVARRQLFSCAMVCRPRGVDVISYQFLETTLIPFIGKHALRDMSTVQYMHAELSNHIIATVWS